MRRSPLLLAVTLLTCASAPAAGQEPDVEPTPAVTWRVIYLRGNRAPRQLVQSVGTALTTACERNGVTIASPPSASERPASLDKAHKLLDNGRAAFTQLKLDEAETAFVGAENAAIESATNPKAVAVVFESRIRRARIALVKADARNADLLLEAAATLGPERADKQAYPPEIVAAYAEARRRIDSGPKGTVEIQVQPTGAKVLIDGRVSRAAATLPPGEHFVAAAAPGYLPSAMKINVSKGGATKVDLFLIRSQQDAIATLRKAWRGGDPATAARAANTLADAASSSGVLAWDLRSKDGQVQALLVPIARNADNAPPPMSIALPAGAAGAGPPLEQAIAQILTPPKVGNKKASRKVWYWTAAAIAAAVLAGGGVAIAAQQAPSSSGDLTIVIQR